MSKVILIKHAGHIIPRPMVERMLKLHTSFLGTAMPIPAHEDNAAEFLVEHMTDLPTVDEFMEVQEANKDLLSGVFFGEAKDGVNAEDYQPFTLVADANNKPLVTAMVEGEYYQEKHKDSKFSGEYHMVNDILIPSVMDLWENCGGELPKLIEKMKRPVFKAIVDSQSINRGVVVVITQDGQVLKFEKGNTLGATFNEFWASNKLGYEEKSSQEAAIEKPSRVGFVRRAVAAVTPAVVVAKPVPEPVKADTAVVPPRPKIKPHEDLIKKSGNKLKGFYENNCVSVPNNWREGPEAEANDAYIAKNAGKWRKADEALEEVKKKVLGVPVKPEEKKPFVPIITPKTKDMINDLIKSAKVQALLSENRVLDPAKAETRKLGSFSEQQGIPIEDMFRWDTEILEMVGKADITALAMIAREALNEVMALVSEGPSDTKVEEEIKQPDAPPVVVEKPVTRGFAARRPRVAA